jgi:hypothetical protein
MKFLFLARGQDQYRVEVFTGPGALLVMRQHPVVDLLVVEQIQQEVIAVGESGVRDVGAGPRS